MERRAVSAVFFALIFLMLPSTLYTADKQWTWLYQKLFSIEELAEVTKPAVTLCKEDLPAFNQLLFSPNATRPTVGFFSFWVQARDKRTQKWGKWHKMMEWGAGVQRSFNSDQGMTKYVHVRLEMGKNHADGFRIKTIAHDGASLAQLKAVFVSLSDLTKFEAETMGKRGMQVPSVMISGVPKKSQMALAHDRNKHMCSPTSCSMLVSYLCGKEVNAIDFAEKSFDTGLNAYGSWPFNVAHAFEYGNGNLLFATVRLPSFYGLYEHLQKGIPVVVSVRGYLDGAPKAYDNGHLLMVVGFDAKKQHVVCHDPAFSRDELIVQRYPLKSFLSAWERSNRLAYLAHPAAKTT